MGMSFKDQFSSVTQSCLTLCDPMDCSMPGFPVYHQLPELAQTHVHWVDDVLQLSSCVVPFSSCPQSFLALGPFPMSRLFASGGQSIGASVSASVLPMTIQGWFPLGLTGWISLLSKGLSRVFPCTTIQKHQFFGFCLGYQISLLKVVALKLGFDELQNNILFLWFTDHFCICHFIISSL